MEITLLENERIDDLTSQLKIIQSRDVFSFSMDAVLLAHFPIIPQRGKIIDLCSGNGVIPLLLATKTRASIIGVEVQERLVDMANRSIIMNGLKSQIEMVHSDLKEAPKLFGKGVFDLVTVNPPYLPLTGQDQNLNKHLAIARHEILTNLEEVIQTSDQLLKVGGRLVMVHRPSRLVELISLMRGYRIEPKKIQFVHPHRHKEANMVLIEAKKHGGKELHVLPPLIVYGEDGKYTEEIYQIYYGDQRG
ncbi:tRNA1(Val) (adenine(37)-N6)-methyltransferase [Tepidibacillus fermentans]|uniref:tRNA1(Val) A37 N6-methylase TrmN6 n=1 Tax=Tepidibacillus fermentans TaxID=1281767 RepID=A0A4R3K562_9BACI|nr:tRNA1(Val) (adenine(37)-N6)-methyltransferase [Tepidibacillus fermentans]TCS77958.1 tRNA1(Val) A37 N6-methylase TrmN6 [Tepidibacillus fermentans]